MPRKSADKSNWKREWREQCRRGLDRSMEDRMRYGFVYTYKPVLDDAPYRVFATMADYREWCESNLPRYLGYYRPGRKGRKH